MRALLQRTTGARVRVGDEIVGEIGAGLVVLLGVGPDDDEATTDALARRVTELRIFDDAAGRTNLSLVDVGGAVLVVSQFTLFADTRRGRRPGFTGAAAPELAERLYLRFAAALQGMGVDVATGRFNPDGVRDYDLMVPATVEALVHERHDEARARYEADAETWREEYAREHGWTDPPKL